jgi:hypothetical protein
MATTRTQHNPRRSVECIPTTLNIDYTYLVHVVINWHFPRVPLWRPGFMSKGANDGRPKEDRPMTEEATPLPLSEKLIAQLQNAVSAAQRKRIPDPNDASASQSTERQS